jgi:hypothetical protein
VRWDTEHGALAFFWGDEFRRKSKFVMHCVITHKYRYGVTKLPVPSVSVYSSLKQGSRWRLRQQIVNKPCTLIYFRISYREKIRGYRTFTKFRKKTWFTSKNVTKLPDLTVCCQRKCALKRLYWQHVITKLAWALVSAEWSDLMRYAALSAKSPPRSSPSTNSSPPKH